MLNVTTVRDEVHTENLLVVGVDVSKDKLDLYAEHIDSGENCRQELDGQIPNRNDEIEDKIRHRLKKQRDHLFVFLDHEKVEATNNRTERRLRPAVMRRKLSCGNRTPEGEGVRADGECSGDVCPAGTFGHRLSQGNDVPRDGAPATSLNRYRSSGPVNPRDSSPRFRAMYSQLSS